MNFIKHKTHLGSKIVILDEMLFEVFMNTFKITDKDGQVYKFNCTEFSVDGFDGEEEISVMEGGYTLVIWAGESGCNIYSDNDIDRGNLVLHQPFHKAFSYFIRLTN